MRGGHRLTIGAVCALAGCMSYTGGARAIDPSRIADEPGWIAAGPTPEVRQRGTDDCGPAVLSMMAGRWGVPLSLDAATHAVPPPTELGVKLGFLRAAVRGLGLVGFAIEGSRDTLVHELRAGRPVIVGLFHPYRRGRVKSHYEVVVAMHLANDELVTIDPAAGFRVRRWADLDHEWEAAGRPALVVLGPRNGQVEGPLVTVAR